MKKFYFFILLLQGCQYGAGIGVRPTTYDNRNLDNMSNPVGIIRVEQKVGKVNLIYEHLSSIPDKHENYGINTFGAVYMLGQ